DAWLIGRVSMDPYAGRVRVPTPKPKQRIPRTDFIARRADGYAIAIDPFDGLAARRAAGDAAQVVEDVAGWRGVASLRRRDQLGSLHNGGHSPQFSQRLRRGGAEAQLRGRGA